MNAGLYKMGNNMILWDSLSVDEELIDEYGVLIILFFVLGDWHIEPQQYHWPQVKISPVDDFGNMKCITEQMIMEFEIKGELNE